MSLSQHCVLSFILFFTVPPPPAIYPLPLHDALPIFSCSLRIRQVCDRARSQADGAAQFRPERRDTRERPWRRSEEHTSELQSRGHLVCRLLLEKKNKIKTTRETVYDVEKNINKTKKT